MLEILGIMMVAAALSALVLSRLHVPSIVVYIGVGLMLGPLLGYLPMGGHGENGGGHDMDAVHVIAEIGIILLLFVVGLELSLDRIRDVGKVAVAAGLGQVVFTAVGGFVICLLLGFTAMESLFLSMALTFSSTVVVVKLLDQKRHLHALYGRIAVGIFLVQDLVVIVVLTFLAGLGEGASLSFSGIGMGLTQAFAGMAIILAVAILAARYLLARPTQWAARSGVVLFLWSLCWCLLFVLAAQTMRLSPEIGAFLAGLSLAQLPCAHELRRRVHPLMNFFIAVFFVSLGAQMDLAAARESLGSALVLSVFVLIGNPLIFMIIIARAGYSRRTSFLTSVTVAQISEFSFIFAAAGLAAGLIDEGILSIIALVGLITIVTSAYMILYSEKLYDLMERWHLLRVFGGRSEEEPDAFEHHGLQGHVVVVGMNALGRELVRLLDARGEKVLAIDTDRGKMADLPGLHEVGDASDSVLFEEMGMHRAKLVISALHIEDANRLLAWRCRQAGVPVAIHAFDRFVTDGLRHLGVSHLIDARSVGSHALEQALQDEGVLTP